MRSWGTHPEKRGLVLLLKLWGAFCILTSKDCRSTMVKIVEMEAATHTAPLLAELPALSGAGTRYPAIPQAPLLCCIPAQLQTGKRRCLLPWAAKCLAVKVLTCKWEISLVETSQGKGGLNPTLPSYGRGPRPWRSRVKGGWVALPHCGRINCSVLQSEG